MPAFAGLGSPWWDPYARGTIIGITRGTTRAQLARAVVEAMAFQTRDVVDAMSRGNRRRVSELRVDGGAAVMDLLLQIQADQLGVTRRPAPPPPETTALGAAYAAGIGIGAWTIDDVRTRWSADRAFIPRAERRLVVDAGRAAASRRVALRASGSSAADQLAS